MSSRNIYKTMLVFVMAFITLIGSVPANAFALENEGNSKDASSQYIYVDGERISLDDERILNIVTVQPPIKPVQSGVGVYTTGGGTAPNVSSIVGMSGAFERDSSVTMDGHKVSAARYIAKIDDIGYEAYCCDPLLRGPESDAAVYDMTGEANAKLKNAVQNGFPINSEWSGIDLDNDERMWWVYITRVAVAMANNPTRNFAGEEDAINRAKALADGTVTADSDAYPAIMINGEKNTKDTGRTINVEVALSEAFEITQNRKTNNYYNPFRFEWGADTPAGAKLVVDGTVIATAPDNPDIVYKDDISSFYIEMPNEEAFAGKTAIVNLVGIHNQYANKVWLMQNPDEPDRWQDIIFYIPEITASAAFSFEMEPYTPEEASLRIIKQNPSGNGLSGAVFDITGPNGYSKKETTPSNGVIKLTGLIPGEYTVTEITPPKGYELAEPASITVTIEPDSTGVIERVFINKPETKDEPEPTSVIIQKIDALTRENIPGALIRLRGISSAQVITEDGQIKEIDNTGINLSQVLTKGATTGGGDVKSTVTDGVWTLEGLPYGAYVAEEERAPANYSLLPQHTSYSFWLLPGNVIIKLNQADSTVYVDDVQLTVHEALNAAIAGIQNYDDAEGLASELQGILDELLSQLQIDAVFTVEVDKSTNSQLITFENFVRP